MMTKIKMGELNVDRDVWVRDKISTDHVRCLVSDLVNGAKFPPLKVEKNTMVIVGGNHRYMAYKHYYGEGYQNKPLEVEFIELPPFNENPIAWKRAALDDNDHLAERLRYGDRNKLAADLHTLEVSDEVIAEMIPKLHFTTDSWREFCKVMTKNTETTRESKEQLNSSKLDSSKQRESKVDREVDTASVTGTDKHHHRKTVKDDIQPVDVKNISHTFNSQVISKVSGLLALLKNSGPEHLNDRTRGLLQELADAIRLSIKQSA